MVGIVTLYPREMSSDRACRIEILEDIAEAVKRVLIAAVPGVPVEAKVHAPPESPQYRTVVALKRDWTTDVPIEVQATVEEVAIQFKRHAPERYPHLPLTWMVCKPPEFRYMAILALAPDDDRLPEPRYPRLVKARAVLRPTAFGRKMLGLPPKENAP